MKAKHKVLSTKKLEPSLVQKAKESGIEIIEQEFISIQPVWNQEIGELIIQQAMQGKVTVALTSANAVDMLSRYMHQRDTFYIIPWKIYCLSGKTRTAVQQSSMLDKSTIAATAENAATLAEQIISNGEKEILFLCGNKRRDELPSRLRATGILVNELIVYETVALHAEVNEDFDAVLFFSPSGVQSFFAVNQLKKETVCFAIGVTTASSIKTLAGNEVIPSIAPTPAMLINELIEHFNQRASKKKPR